MPLRRLGGFGRPVTPFRKVACKVGAAFQLNQLDGLERVHEVVRDEAEFVVLPIVLNGPQGFCKES